MKLHGASLMRKIAAFVFALEPPTPPRLSPLPDPELLPIAFEAGARAAPLRVLVVADAMGATQQISFVEPLAARCAAGAARLVLMAERDIDALTHAGFDRALAALIESERPTAVVFSRAGTRFAGAIVTRARAAGARLVAHLDDDLFAVPAALGAAKVAQHNDPARIARLTIACRRADAIYASTPALGAVLQRRFPDISVAAGALYKSASPPFHPFAAGGACVFGYMGTAGHAADLESIAPAIAQALEMAPEARFETFGTIRMPQSLAGFGARVKAHPRADGYEAFVARLKALGWRAGLAPLEDTPFNACKADTKFVEYAQAGIPAVLADSPVYARPRAAGAALVARTSQEWAEAIVALLRDEQKAAALTARAQGCLTAQYGPATLEAQLVAVLSGAR